MVFDAPLEQVWQLHTTGTGLAQLTPSVADLRIEAVRGGESDEPLPKGAELDISTNPARIGGRDHWTAVITESTADVDRALFRDEMREGPFPTWVHTHRFESVYDDETVMRDRIEYRLPTVAGDFVSPLAVVGFEPVFAYRHWKARRILDAK